jgi:hypothetical protein
MGEIILETRCHFFSNNKMLYAKKQNTIIDRFTDLLAIK